MVIQTKYHGELTIEADDNITFENGIPGFLDEKTFVLLSLDEKTSFFILQSVQTPGIAFVVTSPFFFFKDYEFDLDESTKERLNIQSEQDVEVLVILTVNEPFNNSTANLKAPIILNRKTKLGKQLILNQTDYMTKHHFA